MDTAAPAAVDAAAAAAAAAAATVDAELAAFLAPDETAASLLARTFVAPLRTGLPLVDRFTSFRGGQLLEVAGAAGSGRTTALLQVAATCILPHMLNGVAYGGCGGHVLFYDLDGKLDIVRLLEMLDARVNEAQVAAGIAVPEEMPVVHDCLTRLHVVRCTGSFELLASLRSIRPTLDQLAASPGGLACLLIDNVAAFHYVDRAARGAAAGSGSSIDGGGVWPTGDITAGGAPLTLHRVHTAVAAELRALQQRYRVPVVASKHTLLTATSGGGKQQHGPGDAGVPRETMPKPWQELVSLRLLLLLGGDAPGATSRTARWLLPESTTTVVFNIMEAGISLS